MESFNGRFRDECLNSHGAPSGPTGLDDTRQIIEEWRIDYNRERPHSSLGYRTPEEGGALWAHDLIRPFDGSMMAAGFS